MKPFKQWKKSEIASVLLKLKGTIPYLKSQRKILRSEDEEDDSVEQKPTNYYYGYTPIEEIKNETLINKVRKKHRISLEPIRANVDFVKLNMEISNAKKKEKASDEFNKLKCNFAYNSESRSSRTQSIIDTYNGELERKKKYLKQLHKMLLKQTIS
jgi:hypothetical protein